MDDAVGIHDIDMDIQNFIKKRMGDDESVFYVRTKRISDESCDVVWAVQGNVIDIIESFADTEALAAIANVVTASHIKAGVLDMEQYMKDYDENPFPGKDEQYEED